MNENLLTKEELAVRLNISAYDVDKLRKDKKCHVERLVEVIDMTLMK